MEKTEHAILLVDDEVNIIHSLQRVFRKEGYRILTATSGMEGLDVMAANKVSLVISDNRMPEMDGVTFLSRVKEQSPDTVRFMLTGYADIKAVMAAINSGEVSRYITKPWNDDEIKGAVKDALERYDLKEENRNLLEITKRQNLLLMDLNHNLEAKVEAKTKTIRDNFFAFVRIFADLMQLYDGAIGGHSKRVAMTARELALALGLDDREVDLVEAAALLHTAGLIGVPRAIIEKPDEELTMNERALLRHCPVLTQSLFSTIDTLRQVSVLIRCLMENYDGTGYPDRLKGEEIPYGSRIIAVCKAYDGAAHGKVGLSIMGPVDLLRKESGKLFDPEIVNGFLKLLSRWKEDRKTVTLRVADLRENMVLAEDLTTEKGRLLVPKGNVLTVELINKIVHFNRIDPVAAAVVLLESAESAA